MQQTAMDRRLTFLPTRSSPAVARAALLIAISCCAGCASAVRFQAPIEHHVEDGETVWAFDTDNDGQADFWQYQHADGRKHAIAYTGSEGPAPRIELDAIDARDCPHFVIALDGVPFELVAQLYEEGHFRFFHPPARVVCCFPAMTDLAIAEVLHVGPCRAYQAQYFDRAANRLVEGNDAYLNATNSPWVTRMAYRCSFWWDVLVYLNPQAVFDHELRGIVAAFGDVDAGEAWAYSVGTAGLGTRGGRDAILAYLRTVDRLCEQIIHERRGHVKITLTADHGHNLVRNRWIRFDDVLESGGYHLTKSLRAPHDVVEISYGLVTYAEFHTADPAGVAACLLQHEDVEFTCYPEGDHVVVAGPDGPALIRHTTGGFTYDHSAGDPLHLAPIIAALREDGHVSADGTIDGPALFRATLLCDYPDPLERIWDTFHTLVDNPPDVIANLRDGACHGSGFFHAMIGDPASTHGSLNRRDCTTFMLTMLGPTPAALHSRDVLPVLMSLREDR